MPEMAAFLRTALSTWPGNQTARGSVSGIHKPGFWLRLLKRFMLNFVSYSLQVPAFFLLLDSSERSHLMLRKSLVVLSICILLCLASLPTLAQTIPNWQPNTAYAVGALVMFNNVEYKCIQAHTSQVGWEPPNVPALWQPVSGTPSPSPTPTPAPTPTPTPTPTPKPTPTPTPAPSPTPPPTPTPSGSCAPAWSATQVYTGG